jgi:hypothetical protein
MVEGLWLKVKRGGRMRGGWKRKGALAGGSRVEKSAEVL